MLYFLFFTLIILDFICAYFKVKSKILVTINLIFIWVIISGYFSGVDIDNYRYDYQRLELGYNSNFNDIGYVFLCNIFIKFNLDFFVFKKIITAVCVFLVGYSINKFKVNNLFILGCYISYQLIFDTIQYRNFIGMSILIFAIPFLFNNNKKGDYLFAFFIIISSTFHSIMIVYLLYLFRGKSKLTNNIRKLFFLIGIVLSILTLLNGARVPFINKIVSLLDFEKANQLVIYSQGSKQSFAFLLPVVSLITCLYFFNNKYKQKKYKNEEQKILNYIYKINELSAIFLPFCFMSFQWYRIIRNINLINYSGMSCIQGNLNILSKKRIYIYGFVFIFLSFWIYSDVFRFLTIDNAKTIFENNIFINKNIFTNLNY